MVLLFSFSSIFVYSTFVDEVKLLEQYISSLLLHIMHLEMLQLNSFKRFTLCKNHLNLAEDITGTFHSKTIDVLTENEIN